jgi:4-carboxymuconolactone decarboxylase
MARIKEEIMRGAIPLVFVLTLVAPVPTDTASAAPPAQSTSAPGGALPADVDPVSRNRLPQKKPDVTGAAAIRLHASGANVRWASPLGRALTELSILVTAREHDQPYEWSLHEMEAVAVGLEPATIDVVRNRRPLAQVPERQAAVIQMGREIFGTHALSSSTYARALKLFGAGNLVDIVDLMGTYAATGARLTAFNQQMPPGWKQFLPLPFTPPDDVHPDSRSRLPLIRAKTANPQANLYARQLAPEGTGPNHIARHAGGRASLEASAGRRAMGLAVLVAAREHHSQYDWAVNEPIARQDGLEAATIDVVRHGRPVAGLPEKDAALIQFGREMFSKHTVSVETYGRALKAYGERDLVVVVDLLAQHGADTTRLAAFDQRLPAGQAPPLPAR